MQMHHEADAPSLCRVANADPPWLSVILPTHHGERWLEATLDSLVAQTRRGFECILIDSSATDETLAVAERYRDRLRLYIEHRPDLKDWQAKTNFGADLAKSEHLCMLHQDDLWEPERAEHVQGWIQSARDAALHLHPCWIVDEDGRRLGLWRCPLPAGKPIPRETILGRLIVQNFIAICTPVIRRDRFLAVGGLDRTLWYTADWDLYLKLAQDGSVLYHREALAEYRVHRDALTVTGSRCADDFRAQMSTVLERHLGAAGAAGHGRVLARARASVAINAALAGALHRRRGDLPAALIAIVRLGPVGMLTFLRDTRLIERCLPRLRSYVLGGLSL